MAKVFLSHKSEDKVYVEKVVSLIGRNNCVYDKFTFEAGMKTIDEIMKGLDESDLFVIFLSDKALNSRWVKMELRKSKELLDAHRILQIYPIIIDQNIQYNDSRIPSWMQKAYNIRPILSPKIASQKIRARLAIVSV